MAAAATAAATFLASSVPPSPLAGSGGRPAYFFYPQLTGPHCAGQSGALRPTSHMAQPAGLFGMLVDALSLYYSFSGNRTVLALIPPLLDYMLHNGSTPNLTHWAYPGVPFASSTAGDLYFSGAADMDVYGSLGCGDGYGIIEPDKIGEFGLHLLTGYKLFGTTAYRSAVIHYADVLARNMRDTASLGEHESPWPFRVNAQTGVIREPYTSAVIMPLRLFDELIHLGWGNVATYAAAREALVEWLLHGPMVTSWWCAYFEDIGAFGKEMKDQQPDMCAMDRHHPLELRGGWENTTLKNGSTWFTCNFVRCHPRPLTHAPPPPPPSTLFASSALELPVSYIADGFTFMRTPVEPMVHGGLNGTSEPVFSVGNSTIHADTPGALWRRWHGCRQRHSRHRLRGVGFD